MHIGRQRGNFDGEIEARQWRAVWTKIAKTGLRVVRIEFRHRLKDLKIAMQEGIRLDVADDRFTEQINGGGDAVARVLFDSPDEVITRFTRDELTGHVHDLRLDRPGDESRRK